MPVTKSAKKKLRKDRKIEKENAKLRRTLNASIKKARKNPTQKIYSSVSKIIDKAAKRNLIHKNKAGRLKSKLALSLKKSAKKTPAKKS